MKLSKLKQQLMERNNQLPEDKRRTSSVRKVYQKNLGYEANYETKFKQKLSVEKPSLTRTHSATTYKQSNELSVLDEINEIVKQGESSPLPNTVDSTNNIDSIKIIGITGSKGKSTTAFLVHEYIKSLGYKSVLYSSIRIDSPASYINVNEPCEIPLQNENVLLNIIEEAEAYQADYVVMEVNESAIEKGLIDGIPFTVRALTNINPKHNEEHYSPNEYVKIKKSFFENIPVDEDCTCVFGLTGSFTREEFNEILKLNNRPKITYGTKYICEVRNADYTNLDSLLYDMKSDLNGLEMKMRVKDNSYDFKTNVILPHNAINFTCAIAIIESLNIFDASIFKKCISNIVIPGREEVIKSNNRTIVIGLSLIPALENFKMYQGNLEVGKIKVVTGALGSGFVSWNKAYSSERYISQRSSVRRFAMNYLKENANFAYLTSNDNAVESALSIAQEMQKYLNNKIPSTIVVDRRDAIKKALIESKPNDLIYIAGRGNRRIFCDSANTMKLIQDKEVVQELLEELGW